MDRSGVTAPGYSFGRVLFIEGNGVEGVLTEFAFRARGVFPGQGRIVTALDGFNMGTFMALIHAVFTITFRAEQIVTGVAINFLALGLTLPEALTPELSELMPSSSAFMSASAMMLLHEFPVQRMRTFFMEFLLFDEGL